MAKTSSADLGLVRGALINGRTYAEIQRMYGVSSKTIAKVRKQLSEQYPGMSPAEIKGRLEAPAPYPKLGDRLEKVFEKIESLPAPAPAEPLIKTQAVRFTESILFSVEQVDWLLARFIRKDIRAILLSLPHS